MDEKRNPVDGDLGTSTVMTGAGLLVFLKNSGVDVNIAIENALKGANVKIKPEAVIERILEDRDGILSRYFNRPKHSSSKKSSDSVSKLTEGFQTFVLDVLIHNKRPQQFTPEVIPQSQSEEESPLDAVTRNIYSIALRWSENYDQLSDLIPDFLELLRESYENPKPGSPEDYDFDDPDSDDYEDNGGVRTQALENEDEEEEEEYIPYPILNTLVSVVDILSGKTVSTGIKIRDAKNKERIGDYIHQLKTTLSLLEKIYKLRWSLFFYYPEGPNSIGVKIKDATGAINIYLEEFSDLNLQQSWWERMLARIKRKGI